MKTGEYCDREGVSISELARRCGVSVSTLSRPLQGEGQKVIQMALMIEDATDGKLTAEDFLADVVAATRERNGTGHVSEATASSA